jgi:hypothetical protein
VSGPLDGGGESALVLGAGAALTAGRYFTPVRDVRPQLGGVFIIYIMYFVPAEEAHFPLGYVFAPSRSPGSGIFSLWLCHPILYP